MRPHVPGHLGQSHPRRLSQRSCEQCVLSFLRVFQFRWQITSLPNIWFSLSKSVRQCYCIIYRFLFSQIDDEFLEATIYMCMDKSGYLCVHRPPASMSFAFASVLQQCSPQRYSDLILHGHLYRTHAHPLFAAPWASHRKRIIRGRWAKRRSEGRVFIGAELF